MKGKIAFVLGAAAGYVLGSRAGRARYEQIKRGAAAVWDTPVVQQGVKSVKDVAGDGIGGVKHIALDVAKTVFDTVTQPKPRPQSSTSHPADRGPADTDAAPSGASEDVKPA